MAFFRSVLQHHANDRSATADAFVPRPYTKLSRFEKFRMKRHVYVMVDIWIPDSFLNLLLTKSLMLYMDFLVGFEHCLILAKHARHTYYA